MVFPMPKGTIVGMDEAGRGSWAGPVVAAAVILPRGLRLGGLNDSKLVLPAKREELYLKITQNCPHGIGIATHEEVDQHGLLRATYFAFKRALEHLGQPADHILIDGRDHFSFAIPHTSIIRGDQKVRCISAASILAKVTRDHLMVEYAHKFPQYGFEQHKGYGTEAHQTALRQHGPCELHRKSYAPLKNLQWVQEAFL
jgi:ribonuclease HII